MTAAAIERLTDELRGLREAIDEIREDLDWVIRQGKLGCRFVPPGFQLTSFPVDSSAPDFAKRVNAFTATDLPTNAHIEPRESDATQANTARGGAVDDDEPTVEMTNDPLPLLSARQFHPGAETPPKIPFCCAEPDLEWIGDHQHPEIICACCGELAATLVAASRPQDGVTLTPPSAVNTANPLVDDAEVYCCEAPALAWYGSPDAPGIACSQCGYVIVENGSILGYGDSDDRSAGTRSSSPKVQQGRLFSDDGG